MAQITGNFATVCALARDDVLCIFAKGAALGTVCANLLRSTGAFDQKLYVAKYKASSLAIIAPPSPVAVFDDLGNEAPLTGDIAAMWDDSAASPRVVLFAHISHPSLTSDLLPPCTAIYVARADLELRSWSSWSPISPASAEGSIAIVPELSCVHYAMQSAVFSSTQMF